VAVANGFVGTQVEWLASLAVGGTDPNALRFVGEWVDGTYDTNDTVLVADRLWVSRVDDNDLYPEDPTTPTSPLLAGSITPNDPLVDNTVATGDWTGLPNGWIAQPFTVSRPTTVAAVDVLTVDPPATGTVRIGIVGATLTAGALTFLASVVVDAATLSDWDTITLPAPLLLAPATTYHLAVEAVTGFSVGRFAFTFDELSERFAVTPGACSQWAGLSVSPLADVRLAMRLRGTGAVDPWQRLSPDPATVTDLTNDVIDHETRLALTESTIDGIEGRGPFYRATPTSRSTAANGFAGSFGAGTKRYLLNSSSPYITIADGYAPNGGPIGHGEVEITLLQDATGGRVPRFDTSWAWAPGVSQTVVTTPNTATLIRLSWQGADFGWIVTALLTGLPLWGTALPNIEPITGETQHVPWTRVRGANVAKADAWANVVARFVPDVVRQHLAELGGSAQVATYWSETRVQEANGFRNGSWLSASAIYSAGSKAVALGELGIATTADTSALNIDSLNIAPHEYGHMVDNLYGIEAAADPTPVIFEGQSLLSYQSWLSDHPSLVAIYQQIVDGVLISPGLYAITGGRKEWFAEWVSEMWRYPARTTLTNVGTGVLTGRCKAFATAYGFGV
jgi:hypothetical protein